MDGFTYLMVSIILMTFASFFVPEGNLRRVTDTALFSITLIASLSLTRKGSFVFRAKMILFFLCQLFIWVNTFIQEKNFLVFGTIVVLLFFGLVGHTLFISIRDSKEVTRNVLFGSVAGYFILGITGSLVLSAFLAFNPNAMDFPNSPPGFNDTLYFSLVSMSTLGYGDVLPVSDEAKGISLIITISGQLYLAIIVASLIGKSLTEQRQPKDL